MHPSLLLENQLCFPVYAASHLIVRAYQPYLRPLGLTYPQYLVMLVLWEKDDIAVGSIVQRLMLQTNTVTPLLQRMEQQGFIHRTKGSTDKRETRVKLTRQGKALEIPAQEIPAKLMEALNIKPNGPLEVDKMQKVTASLKQLLAANTQQ